MKWSSILIGAIASLGAIAACDGESQTQTGPGGGTGGIAAGGNAVGGLGGGGNPGGNNAGGGGAGGGGELVDPGYPHFPENVGTLSVTIRTADIDFAGTDDGHLSLCLNANTCFLLDTLGTADDNDPWPNEFQRNEVDTFHFEGVALPRSAVDRVELRTSDGENAFFPACIAVRFDGEAVHCNDTLDITIGSDTGELTSFVDPGGLQNSCASCYPAPVAGGPMLGAVTDTTARLWVRTDATRRVSVWVAEASSPNKQRLAAYSYPDPKSDFVGEVLLEQLSPGTDYLYQFEIDGRGLSDSYPFRTAPAKGGQVTRIAMGSCSRDYPAPIFSEIVAAQPDMFIHLGDNHYANANYAGNTDAERLAILRWHYRRSIMQPERALIAATMPSLAVWDDHDFVGNNTVATAPGRDAALRGFDEYWANSIAGIENVPGTFSKESYGDIDIFLLDDRYYRSANNNPAGSVLGAGQTQWLKDELAASTAVFKLVVSGSLFSESFESWKKFPTARADLFQFMADNQITGVVLLSGDVHRSLFRSIPRGAGYALPEIVSSPLNNGNSSCSNDADADDVACFDSQNYFVTLDINTTVADPTLTATIINQSGGAESTWPLKASDLQ